MRSKCCFPYYIPPVASLNISYDIRRKASEAAAEITKEATLKNVLFRSISANESLIVCVWNLPSQKSSRFLLDYECSLRYRFSSKKIRIIRIIVYAKAAHKLVWFFLQEIICLNFEESEDTFL